MKQDEDKIDQQQQSSSRGSTRKQDKGLFGQQQRLADGTL